MKKFFAFLLTFAMLFSLAMPAMAAEGDSLSTIYIDVGQLAEAASVQSVWIRTNPNAIVNNDPMTHVSGTIYSYDISAAVAAGDTIAEFETFSDDGETRLGSYYTANFETGKNLWTATGEYNGTWSTYVSTGGNTGNTDNPTEGEVSANYDPTIEITDVKLTGDAVSYDAASNTYTVTIPAGETNVPVTIVASGKNLGYATSDDPNRLSLFSSGYYLWDIGTVLTQNENDGTWTWDNFIVANDIYSPSNIGYSNLSDSSDVVYYDVYIVQAYAITNTTTDTNGTITVPEEAAAGETVTVGVSPAEGYMLDTLTVMNGETKVEVSNNSFVMPAGAVTVTATFKLASVPQTITVAPSNNGTVTAALDKATAGTTVTLTVDPADDYRLATLTVNDGAVEVTKVDDTTYTFVMPDAEATVNATFEKIPHSVNVETSENGTVSADKQTAVAGDTVTLTWTAEDGYTLDKITVTDAENNEVTIDQGVLACTFVMPSSDVTVTATFKVQLVTSVAITWGSMEFTYDDTVAEGATEENGWTCEAGANNIVVENTGETTFTAQAAYASYEGYESITGSFDPASKELAIGEKYTFTLELDGKPTKALSGDKIGKVTITINESAEG